MLFTKLLANILRLFLMQACLNYKKLAAKVSITLPIIHAYQNNDRKKFVSIYVHTSFELVFAKRLTKFSQTLFR